MRRTVLAAVVVWAAAAWGQAPRVPEALDAELRRIFLDRAYETKAFRAARWVENGAAYTTLEGAEGEGPRDLVRYDTATGARTVLVAAAALKPGPEAEPLRIHDYAWSADGEKLLIFTNTRRVWRQQTRGDYWVWEKKTGALRKLGGAVAEASLLFAKFSPDGERVAYVHDHNLYVEELRTGAVTALTKDGSATIINGTSDWVYEEEFAVRDGFRWSPDGRRIAYWQFDTSGVQEFTLINDTDSLYPRLTRIPYPKAGTTNSAVRVGVVAVGGGATTWLAAPGDARQQYLARIEWGPDSKLVALQQLNRAQNRNDLLLADAETGAVRRAFRDEDAAWVDVVDDFHWVDGGAQFTWLSERGGWRQAWVVARDGSGGRAVTPEGADVVRFLRMDSGEQWLYYIASPENATQRYLYRMRLNGQGRPERLTPASETGTHSYSISPDGRWAFHTWSTFDRPPVTELVSLPAHQTVRVLEENEALRRAAAGLLENRSEFFRVTGANGVTLDGWMIRPKGFDAAKKYPVLVHVYGEPASTTVNDAWAGARGLFHRALAEAGYVVVSLDNRGTPAPKGRAWRKAVYGEVGVASSADQAAALRALLAERPYLDGTRVAVWGWSGGGANTLNLMFRQPDLYQVGMAVAPVPDQRLYDTIYQERYMGLPQENKAGYERGSPIHFAEGLKGRLLIVHGSGDDNVHYQGVERLVNRLVELGKPFDLMVYPNRTHAISEGEGTSFHLHSLLARYLWEHLPAGGQ